MEWRVRGRTGQWRGLILEVEVHWTGQRGTGWEANCSERHKLRDTAQVREARLDKKAQWLERHKLRGTLVGEAEDKRYTGQVREAQSGRAMWMR